MFFLCHLMPLPPLVSCSLGRNNALTEYFFLQRFTARAPRMAEGWGCSPPGLCSAPDTSHCCTSLGRSARFRAAIFPFIASEHTHCWIRARYFRSHGDNLSAMLWGYAAGKGTHPALQRQVLAGHIPLWLMCSYILAALILLDVLSLVSCNLISCRVPVFRGEFHLGLIWEEGEMSSQHPSKACKTKCPWANGSSSKTHKDYGYIYIYFKDPQKLNDLKEFLNRSTWICTT